MTPEQAAELRKPFPKSAIGKLPKGGVMLDFVGHAAATDRLLAVDPAWWWEPLALDETGLPAYDKAGGLWIKLHLCDTVTLGYGDGANPKERIGDAIRNAAMRRGVALDLWAKEDLSAIHVESPVAETDPDLLVKLRNGLTNALGVEALVTAGRDVSVAFNRGRLADADKVALREVYDVAYSLLSVPEPVA